MQPLPVSMDGEVLYVLEEFLMIYEKIRYITFLQFYTFKVTFIKAAQNFVKFLKKRHAEIN